MLLANMTDGPIAGFVPSMVMVKVLNSQRKGIYMNIGNYANYLN